MYTRIITRGIAAPSRRPLKIFAVDPMPGKTFAQRQVPLVPRRCPRGTWEAVLNDAEWRNLLKRTTFYWVGHHGSHNATPIDFVEHTIGHDVVAMVSTIERLILPNIPRQPLREGLLRQKAKIARSDREDELETVFTVAKTHCIETRIRL